MFTTAMPKNQTTLESKDAMRLFLACAEMFKEIPIADNYFHTQIADLQYNQLEPADTIAEQLPLALNTQAAMLAGFTPINGFYPASINWPLPETDDHGVWNKFKKTYAEFLMSDNTGITLDLETGTGIPTSFDDIITTFKQAGIPVSEEQDISIKPETTTVMGFLLGDLLNTSVQKDGKQKLAALFA